MVEVNGFEVKVGDEWVVNNGQVVRIVKVDPNNEYAIEATVGPDMVLSWTKEGYRFKGRSNNAGNLKHPVSAGGKSEGSETPEPEYTGGSVNYYKVEIKNPTSEGVAPYTAECNDIIEALGMNYAEGNAFKAIWRKCAARNGKAKKGYTDGLYDAEKVVFFGQRMVEMEKAK